MTNSIPHPRPRAPGAPGGLRAALSTSIAHIDAGEPTSASLAEVSPEAFDELFDRINTHLAAGLPSAITDEELTAVVNKLRLERHRWQQLQEQEKKPRARRTPATSVGAAMSVNLDDL